MSVGKSDFRHIPSESLRRLELDTHLPILLTERLFKNFDAEGPFYSVMSRGPFRLIVHFIMCIVPRLARAFFAPSHFLDRPWIPPRWDAFYRQTGERVPAYAPSLLTPKL